MRGEGRGLRTFLLGGRVGSWGEQQQAAKGDNQEQEQGGVAHLSCVLSLSVIAIDVVIDLMLRL